MRRPAALYDIRHLLQEQLPHLPGRLRAVLALWVEGTLLGLNGCQDTVTLALAHGLRGPRNLHTLRRLQRELTMQIALIPGCRVRSWRWRATSPRCCSGCGGGGCPRTGGNWTRHRWFWRWIRAQRTPANRISWWPW